MSKDRLTTCLEERHVAYEVLDHRPDVTAQETAEDTHTPGDSFAKCVVLETDGAYAMAVLPATARVDLDLAARALATDQVRLVDEETMVALFPDCEVGAEPPFGNLYGLRVLVDPTLTRHARITFNAGRHDRAFRMRYADFERLVGPTVAPIAAA